VTLEGHAVIVYFAGLRERENLEAAGIGEHGTRPLHEPVQAAQVAHKFVAGTQIKMISVGEHQRGIDIFEMFGRKRFDRGLRADRREERHEQIAMRGGEDTSTARLFLAVIWNSNIGLIVNENSEISKISEFFRMATRQIPEYQTSITISEAIMAFIVAIPVSEPAIIGADEMVLASHLEGEPVDLGGHGTGVTKPAIIEPLAGPLQGNHR